jgi:hypothetical protein
MYYMTIIIYIWYKTFIYFVSFGQSMRKIMMVKERKCLQDIVVEMYWNVKFICNFFQFNYFLNNLNKFLM